MSSHILSHKKKSVQQIKDNTMRTVNQARTLPLMQHKGFQTPPNIKSKQAQVQENYIDVCTNKKEP